MHKSTLAAALALLATGASAAAAADKPPPASPLISRLDACRAISDSAQRLACFDRETATLVTAVKSGSVAVVDRAQVREARRSLFGFGMPRLPFFSGDTSAADTPDQIQSTIRSVEEIGRGRYRMVLKDHGAVWETTESPMRLNAPRPGDRIVIKRGMMGAYFLRIDGQIGVKGRRVG